MTRHRSQLLAQVVLRGLLLVGAVLAAWLAYDALTSSSAQADVRRPSSTIGERSDRGDRVTDPAARPADGAYWQPISGPTLGGDVHNATKPTISAPESSLWTRPGSGSAEHRGAWSQPRPPHDAVESPNTVSRPGKSRAAPSITTPRHPRGGGAAPPSPDPAPTVRGDDKASKDRKADDRPSKEARGNHPPGRGVMFDAHSSFGGQGAIVMRPGRSPECPASHRPSLGRSAVGVNGLDGAPGDRNNSPGYPAPADTAPALAGVGGTDSGSRSGLGVSADVVFRPWSVELAPSVAVASTQQDTAGRSPAPGTRPD